SADRTSPAACPAPACRTDGFRGALGVQPSRVAAGCARTRARTRTGACALVSAPHQGGARSLARPAMSAWILLRGLTRESGHWGGFPALLGDAVEPARIVALDLPGNGALCAQTSPATVEELADACRAELRKACVEPPFFLLGLSLGAMVATAW